MSLRSGSFTFIRHPGTGERVKVHADDNGIPLLNEQRQPVLETDPPPANAQLEPDARSAEMKASLTAAKPVPVASHRAGRGAKE